KAFLFDSWFTVSPIKRISRPALTIFTGTLYRQHRACGNFPFTGRLFTLAFGRHSFCLIAPPFAPAPGRVAVAFRKFQTDALACRFRRTAAAHGLGRPHQRTARRTQRRSLWAAGTPSYPEWLGHPFFPPVGVGSQHRLQKSRSLAGQN